MEPFKDIVQRHIHEGKFNMANALVELEQRMIALEEGMMFFSNWYNKTYGSNLIVPENLAGDNDKPKIIL